MVPWSKKLSDIILGHVHSEWYIDDKCEWYTDDKCEIIDSNLEWQTVKYTGLVIPEIWSASVIDIHRQASDT